MSPSRGRSVAPDPTGAGRRNSSRRPPNLRCAVACTAVLGALLTTPVLAQQGPRGFIGLDIGPSQPFGAFSRRAERAGAGNALAGYTSTLVNLGWRRGRRWGVAALFAYSEYDMRDADAADDDWWQVTFLTIGPMYTVPLGARAAVDLKGTLGFSALTPVIDSRAGPGDVGSGLAVDVRAAVRYDVLRRLAVFAEGGVQATNATFPAARPQQYRAFIGGFGIAFRPQWGRYGP